MKYTALLLVLLLSACSSSEVNDASEIIKTTLKKPKSFVLKEGNILWQSKADKSLIVKVNYTAQNGLNQVIDECKYVAFYQQDGKNKWRENGGIENCIAAGGEEEKQAMVMMRKINGFN
jgi:hypothetical protein